MSRMVLLTADWIVVAPELVLRGGGLVVRGGRVARLVSGGRALERASRLARRVHLDGCALSAGLVDAHAHLELGGYGGRLPRGAELPRWIAALLGLRKEAASASAHGAIAAAAERGAHALLSTGTTAVGDVSAELEWWRAAGRGRSPRIVLQRELLDAFDPARTTPALARVARALPRRRLVTEALAPHAPYTASDELLAAAGRLARRRRLAVAVHWNETPEEREWVERGRGSFAGLLERSPRAPSLARLEEAGLLGSRTALVHGNDATAAERRAVRARGATIVHCPGSHAFFDRAEFDLRAWLRAGARVALGTDSLASNEALDMRRELRLLCAARPWLDPRLAWAMATVNGARALGWPAPAGTLRPGAAADAVAWRLADAAAEPLAALARGELQPARTYISGREVFNTGSPGD
jgi:cytosine/adenosine deaminase-related metal-dependent hydrolase